MKKLTAGIFTVLMGLVSVNAADAAVASKGYVDSFVGENGSLSKAVSDLSGTVTANKEAADATQTALNEYKTANDTRVNTAEGKITTAEGQIATLQEKVTAMEGGELAIGNGAVGTDQLAGDAVTNAKLADNAVQTENIVNGTIVNEDLAAGVAVANIGYTPENAANKATAINDANKNSTTEYPTVGAVMAQIGILSDGAGDLATDIADLKTQKVAVETYNTKVAALEKADTENLAAAKAYAEQKATAAQGAAETTAATFASGVVAAEETARKNADKAINDKIGAVAEGKTVVGMIEAVQTTANAAQTAEQVGSAIDAKISALKLSETYDAKGAADGALDMAKTYAVGKANEALTASVAYTDNYISSLGLQQIASVPVECSDNTNYCTLTANNTGFAWEVIARVDGESVEGRSAVVPQATAKPNTPSTLTK